MSVYRTAWIPPKQPRSLWERLRPERPETLPLLSLATVIAALAIAVPFAEACGAPQPSTAQEAGVAAYAAEQEACITTAKTLEESQACRLAVRARWGRK